MKQLIGVNKTRTLDGQRRFVNDDLEVLSDHFYDGLQRVFIEYSPCVISGCVVSGNSGNYAISSGLMFLNGKLIFFPGAAGYDIKSNTYLVEDDPIFTDERLFDAVAEERPGAVMYRAKLTELTYAGEGIKLTTSGASRTYQKLLGDRIYTQQYKRISNDILVPGSIIMWSGELSNFDDTGLGKELMSGWAICNGNNGTPNLKGRFVVGYDKDVTVYNSPGKTGGEEKVTLGITQIPSHRHVPVPASGEFGLIKRSISGQNTTVNSADNDGSGTQPDLTVAPGADKEVGGNQPHENRPPYYVVAYLMKVGAGSIVIDPDPDPDPDPIDCNIQAGQVLGVWVTVNKQVIAINHQGRWWPFNVLKTTTPRRAYVRGRNFLTWAEFQAAGTLPNLDCFAPYDTSFNGLEHPSQFNGAPVGWARTTDEAGYVCFDEETSDGGGGGGSGSGSGDINGTITFETEVI